MIKFKSSLWITLLVLMVAASACGGNSPAPASTQAPAADPTQAPASGSAPTLAAKPTPAPNAGSASTGLAAYKLAVPLATQWKPDAVLLEIQTAMAPFQADGSIKPAMWTIQFYSPSAGAMNSVIVQNGKAQLSTEVANKMTDDRSVPEPTSLIDSDKAVSIADQNGGADARKNGATQAQVSLIHHALGDLRWVVNYMGADFTVKYSVHVDPKTGNVIFKGL